MNQLLFQINRFYVKMKEKPKECRFSWGTPPVEWQTKRLCMPTLEPTKILENWKTWVCQSRIKLSSFAREGYLGEIRYVISLGGRATDEDCPKTNVMKRERERERVTRLVMCDHAVEYRSISQEDICQTRGEETQIHHCCQESILHSLYKQLFPLLEDIVMP